MNARKVTMIAAVLSFGLFTLEESALAQEERVVAQSQDFNCYSSQSRGTRHVAGRRQRLDGSHYPFRAPQRNDTVRLRYGCLLDPGPRHGHVRRGIDPHNEPRGGQGPRVEPFQRRNRNLDFDRHDRSQHEYREICRSDRYSLVPQWHDHQSGQRRSGLPVRPYRPDLSRNTPSQQRRPEQVG